MYGIKYFDNEIKIIDESKVDNSAKESLDLTIAKQRVIRYYAERVHQLCNMKPEEFKREFLFED